MKRVIVIGCPASGKSTFSKKLAEATGLPLVHLDNVYFKPDGSSIAREEFDRRLGDLLSGDSWIIDGNYRRTLARRLAACDTVFLFDLPTEVCLEGARARVGVPRSDLPWTEKELAPEFEWAIGEFRGKKLPEIYALLEGFGGEKVIFTSREQADRYISDLKGDS